MANTAPESPNEVIDPANKARDLLALLETAPPPGDLTPTAIAALAYAVLAIHDQMEGFRQFGFPVEDVPR